MIQHVVLVAFPQALEPAEEKEFRGLVESWATDIPDLRRIRLGSSIFEQWTQGYRYLLYLEMDDLDAVQRYLRHPAHLAFGQWVHGHDGAFLVFNYALDDTTQILN